MRQFLLLFLLLPAYLLAGCARRQTPTAAIQRSTPTTPLGFLPKSGYWEGESDWGLFPAPVSFDVGADGKIYNLSFAINVVEDGCIFTTDIVPIAADGTFSFAFDPALDESLNTIRGTFDSETTVLGSISESVYCESPSGEFLEATTGSVGGQNWSAEWVTSQSSNAQATALAAERRWNSVDLESGIIDAMMFDPVAPTTLHVAALGVYKLLMQGETLSIAGETLIADTDSLMFDPVTPTIFYAGTMAGVYKSIDGGENWRDIRSGMGAARISALAIDPATPTTLYAGRSDGARDSNIFKSTDGGENWINVSGGFALPPPDVYALAIDPATPTTLYAGTRDGVFKSTNGGLFWVATDLTDSGMGVFSLAIDPAMPNTLYAGTGDSVFKSINGGESWRAINSGLTSGFISALILDPVTPTTLYAGTGDGVFKSINGGESWATVNPAFPDEIVYALAVNPLTPELIYASAGSKVYVVQQVDER